MGKIKLLGASLVVLLGWGIGNPFFVRKTAGNVIDSPASELAESYLHKTPAGAIAPN